MLAIMGPSGAGKTTLLSLLAARKPSSVKMTGEVCLYICYRLKLMELNTTNKNFTTLAILYIRTTFFFNL